MVDRSVTSDLRKVHSDLINLAAELVRGEGLPTCFENGFYASTPKIERRRITKAMDDVDERCRQWAIRLKTIADKLSQQIPPPPPPMCGTPCEGSIKGTCTEPKGHAGHHWFPNMWSDM